MGKKSPTPPAPPDPVITANAQSASNIETATAQQKLNMINTYDPYGSVKYDIDPSAPGGYSQTTALSPAEQQTYNLSKQAENSALNLANQQVGRLDSVLGKGFSYDGLPALQTGVSAGDIQSQFGPSPPIASGFDQGQQVQGRLGSGGRVRSSFERGPTTLDGFDQGQAIQGGVDGAGPIASSIYNQARGSSKAVDGESTVDRRRSVIESPQTGFDKGGELATSFAPGQAVLGGLNGSGNIETGFGASSPLQAGLDRGAPLASGFNQGQGVQGRVQGGGSVATGFDGGGALSGFNQGQAVQGQVGPSNFSQDRASVTDAVWEQYKQRLDPMWGKMQSGLDAKLANQGLGYNSTAYQNASQDFGRQRNDAYGQGLYQAVQAGADEQNTLFGQNVAQGQFANQAAGQQYAQNMGQAEFGNNIALADYQRNQGQAQFQNQAQGQQYAQNASDMQLANQAAAQQFGQGQQAAQFGNTAALQDFQRAQAQGEFANAASQAGYDQNQGRAAFQNAAQSQAYGQNLSSGQFQNQAQAQQFGQNQAQAGFANDAALQDFQRNQQYAQFANAGQQQQYAQAMGQAELQNAAQAQQFGQNAQGMQLANQAAGQQYAQNQGQADFFNQNADAEFQRNQAQAAFANQAQAQRFGQGAAQGEFANQAAAQQYAQNLGSADFYNNAADAQYQRDITGAQFANQAQNQQFQQGMANAQMNNQARTQGAQELAYAQNLPLNQFSALMSSSQVGTPQGIQYTPSNVAPTDVLGAYALNAQVAQQNYQAKQQRQAGLQSGLMGLGSAAILASDSRLKTEVKRVGQTDDGLPIYTYRYKSGGPVHMGVMAQEVLEVRPEAVAQIGGGYLGVDYGRL